jgi:hypothetical protein
MDWPRYIASATLQRGASTGTLSPRSLTPACRHVQSPSGWGSVSQRSGTGSAGTAFRRTGPGALIRRASAAWIRTGSKWTVRAMESRSSGSRREAYIAVFAVVLRRSRRRRKLKAILVAEAGGCCSLCGYDRYIGALQFHHTNGSSKQFGLADRGLTRSLDAVRAEARKCILLCANCHSEVEGGIVKAA